MGSDGGAGKAQRRAEQAERERQQQIAATTARIDSIFDSPERQKQYDNFANALRAFYTEDAGRQKTIADRNQRFALARSGLTGGSAAADAGRTLSDEYNRGILDAERRTQGSLADLISSDQQSRLNLIGMAQSGLNATSAARQAAEAMRANVGNARAAGRAEGLGEIFGSTAEAYRRQNQAAETRRGYQQGLDGLYGSSPWSR